MSRPGASHSSDTHSSHVPLAYHCLPSLRPHFSGHARAGACLAATSRTRPAVQWGFLANCRKLWFHRDTKHCLLLWLHTSALLSTPSPTNLTAPPPQPTHLLQWPAAPVHLGSQPRPRAYPRPFPGATQLLRAQVSGALVGQQRGGGEGRCIELRGGGAEGPGGANNSACRAYTAPRSRSSGIYGPLLSQPFCAGLEFNHV